MFACTSQARIAATLGLLASLTLPGPSAHAAKPSRAPGARPKTPPDLRLGAKWIVREGNEELGVETFKLVVKPDGRSFASGTSRPDAEDSPPLVYMLWRNAAGRLTKYQRVEDRRLGPGVKAFRRGETVRIVGLKDKKRQPVEIPATGQTIWDVKVFGVFWDWLPRLRSGAEARITVLDVDAGVERVARCVHQPTVVLTNRKGLPAEITPWTVAGLGGAGITLYLDAQARLVGARAGERSVLLEGWRWTPPPPVPPDARAGAGSAAPDARAATGPRDAGPTPAPQPPAPPRPEAARP